MTNSRMRYIRDFAINTGAVAAMVRQDPNQPVHFRVSGNKNKQISKKL